MRDILGTNSATTSEDILSSLEAELDASMPPNSSGNHINKNASSLHAPPGRNNVTFGVGSVGVGNLGGLSLPPPGLSSMGHPGPATNSGAALIVSHQQQASALAPPPHLAQTPFSRLPSTSTAPMGTPSSATTPWTGSSIGFDASAVDDFLRNDAERKKEKDLEEEELRKAMDRVLFEDDEEDLTIQTSSNVNAPPGLSKMPAPPSDQRSNVQATIPPPPHLSWNAQAPPGVPSQPPTSDPSALLPPFLQAKVSTSLPVPLHTSTSSGGNTMAMSSPPPQIEVPPHLQQQPQPTALPPQQPPVKVGPPLPPGGFPTVGPTIPTQLPNPQMQMQVPHMNPTGPPPFLQPNIPGPPMPPQPLPLPPQPARFYFHHPHPTSPPVPAAQVASSLMSARDLSYVIHSILRPLHVLHTDPQEDYYFLERGRKLRLMMQNMGMGMNMGVGIGVNVGIGGMPISQAVKTSLPVPKEGSEDDDTAKKPKKGKKNKDPQMPPKKARVLEALFREKVETRAKEWKDKSQVLGHVVKSNVHRPRALLDLSFSEDAKNEDANSKDENIGKKDPLDMENGSEEDQETTRALLWKARKLMDVGYSYWLKEDFKQLNDMLLAKEQTKPEDEEKELQVIDTYVNLSVLLTLPKGRDLLSRCLEYQRAPMGHPNNYTDLSVLMNFESVVTQKYVITPMQLLEILPALFANLFAHPAGVKFGEDRLLYVIISYIIAIVDDFSQDNPVMVDIGNKLIASLKTVMQLSKSQTQSANTNTLKKMLESRARAEVMHALVTKGTEICEHSEALGNEWKIVEEEFINMLSQA